MLAVVCVLVAAMALTACGSNDKAASYTAGTYTAKAAGNNGDVEVSVTFSDSEITEITVGENQETAGLADAPIESIPAAIVKAQSADVDTVSGATNTSNAIITAVKDCMQQATAK